MHNSFPNI